MPIDPVENLSHSFETRLRVCVHKKSFSVFRKQASERMHTRRGGACRAGEKRSSFQQARSTLPYSLSRPLAYLLPIFWPAAQSSSAMHARVYREESCLKGREKWRGKKPGRTAEFPSSRFIIRPTRVFHLPSPLPPFLLLLSLSPCSLVISCLTFFLRVFNWLPFRRVFVLENFNKRAIHPFVPLFSFFASFPPLCYHGESGGPVSVSFRRTPAPRSFSVCPAAFDSGTHDRSISIPPRGEKVNFRTATRYIRRK